MAWLPAVIFLDEPPSGPLILVLMHLRIPAWRRRRMSQNRRCGAWSILCAGILPLATAGATPVRDLAPQPASGPVELDLVLPAARSGTAEPLLATGEPGRGDTVFVYYESPGQLRFGWDSSVAGVVFSPPVATEATGLHHLLVSMGSLLPEGPGR